VHNIWNSLLEHVVFLRLNIGVVEEMIETFKILNGIYDTGVAPALHICQESVTRGNSCK